MAYDAEDVDLQARVLVRGFDPQNPVELIETTVGPRALQRGRADGAPPR